MSRFETPPQVVDYTGVDSINNRCIWFHFDDDLPVAVWPVVIVASARRVLKALHEVKGLWGLDRSCRLPRTAGGGGRLGTGV
jgi:hypothetical protein